MSLLHFLRPFTVPVLVVALVAGCNGASSGDGNGNGGTASGTSQFGIVLVDEHSTDSGKTQVLGRGAFLDFATEVPAGFLRDPYAQVVDTCEVLTPLIDERSDLGVPQPEGEFDFLDAGESLVVGAEGRAEAYATLEKTEYQDDGTTVIVYDPGDAEDPPLPSPLPRNLTLTVPPGAEFPAFTEATFPNVDDLTLTSPTGPGAAGSVDVDTTFEWTPGSGAAYTVVLLEVAPNDLSVLVSCLAADDGSFMFPEEARTELGNDFSGFVVSAGRQGIATHAQGDAALILSLSRGEVYDLMMPLEGSER